LIVGDGPAASATRRLFFALWPDESTRTALVQATRKAVRRSGGRPVPQANYHVTLAFLGNQPVERYDAIVAAAATLTPALTLGPIQLELDRFGYWPRPRVFWLGPARCPEALAGLADALWTAMTPLGLARETRPYRPHVTLARKVAALPEVESPTPLIWQASEFALIESVTDERGARYTVAARFSAGSPHDPN
jgi:2'-5' RNA ligase